MKWTLGLKILKFYWRIGLCLPTEKTWLNQCWLRRRSRRRTHRPWGCSTLPRIVLIKWHMAWDQGTSYLHHRATEWSKVSFLLLFFFVLVFCLLLFFGFFFPFKFVVFPISRHPFKCVFVNVFNTHVNRFLLFIQSKFSDIYLPILHVCLID